MVVKTKLLKKISDNLINDFEEVHLQSENRVFLEQNIDYIYYCYAYLGNTSFLPIRTEISINSEVFIHSRFFMNNEHYVRHQKGKLHQINQNGCGMATKVYYRTI